MIYDFPDTGAPIRQGDIFSPLPRVEISLEEVVIAAEGGPPRVAKWQDVVATMTDSFNVVVPVRPVSAIVATQDCDAVHSRDITLCEIRGFRDVEGIAKLASSPKSWKNILTQHARINQKWYYLPPDSRVGFSEKMAVDFLVTIRVARVDLEKLRSFRTGRLNSVAEAHFRERIAEFFRRYPYDEWYALDPDELQEYKKNYPDAKPFPWQTEGQPQ